MIFILKNNFGYLINFSVKMVDLLEQLLVVQHHLLEECPLEEGDIVVTLEVEEKVVVETTKSLDHSSYH